MLSNHYYVFDVLQSGKQCLCKYLLPSSLSMTLHIAGSRTSVRASSCSEPRINGLADPVDGRINIITSSGQVSFFP